MVRFRLGRREISADSLQMPYIIAEIGVNHECNMETAKRMMEEAAKAGADAVKFQAYKAERLASKDSPAYWDTSLEPTANQFELFKKYDAFWKDEFEELAKLARNLKIDFMATPFDFESADFLEPLVPAFKIASADITNEPLIRHVSRKKKPIILSTGASNLSEISRALEWVKSEGNNMIVLMHCILSYPTPYDDANLGMIVDLKRRFYGCITGYSDHTPAGAACDVLSTAWMLGATVIEKHYTHNRSAKGNDHYHSLDQRMLAQVIERMRFLVKIIGDTNKHVLPSETESRIQARRSVVAARRISAGETIKSEDITFKRPGNGIPPYMQSHVIGGTALLDIPEDTVMTYDMVRLAHGGKS